MTTSAKILAVDFSALLERGKYMRKYIVVLKEEFIRDKLIHRTGKYCNFLGNELMWDFRRDEYGYNCDECRYV